MTIPPHHDRRRFYRLRYPVADRPDIILLGTRYALTEISEEGLRFLSPAFELFRAGQRIAGNVALRSYGNLHVEGLVLRLDGGEVVVQLVKGISERAVVSEQRYLIAKYPRI